MHIYMPLLPLWCFIRPVFQVFFRRRGAGAEASTEPVGSERTRAAKAMLLAFGVCCPDGMSMDVEHVDDVGPGMSRWFRSQTDSSRNQREFQNLRSSFLSPNH